MIDTIFHIVYAIGVVVFFVIMARECYHNPSGKKRGYMDAPDHNLGWAVFMGLAWSWTWPAWAVLFVICTLIDAIHWVLRKTIIGRDG